MGPYGAFFLFGCLKGSKVGQHENASLWTRFRAGLHSGVQGYGSEVPQHENRAPTWARSSCWGGGSKRATNPKNMQHMVCFPCPGHDGRGGLQEGHEGESAGAKSQEREEWG